MKQSNKNQNLQIEVQYLAVLSMVRWWVIYLSFHLREMYFIHYHHVVYEILWGDESYYFIPANIGCTVS